MKKANFYTPAVTVFDETEKPDSNGNRKIWEHLIRGGISGLVIMGSIGEFFALDYEEKRRLICDVTDYAKGRTRLLIGTGGMNAEETILLSNYALSKGADAVLVISPYYFSLSEREIHHYYETVCKKIKGKVYLYNFPARTGYDISPRTTLELLRSHGNIAGYKDTVAEMGHTRALIQTVSEEFPDFEVFSGFDEFMLHNMLSGGSGCIGGLSNIYPELASAWIHAVDERNLEACENIQGIFDQLMEIYSVADIFVPVIKEGVRNRGIEISTECRNPLTPLTEKQKMHLANIMAACEDRMRECHIL
jgi:dihydrodipicolinate synthase/N-acetylneuraminate lyase